MGFERLVLGEKPPQTTPPHQTPNLWEAEHLPWLPLSESWDVSEGENSATRKFLPPLGTTQPNHAWHDAGPLDSISRCSLLASGCNEDVIVVFPGFKRESISLLEKYLLENKYLLIFVQRTYAQMEASAVVGLPLVNCPNTALFSFVTGRSAPEKSGN